MKEYKFVFSPHALLKYFDLLGAKKRKHMYNLFVNEIQPSADDKVVDVGVTPDVTFESSNYFEKLYPYLENVTMASIEDAENLVEYFGGGGVRFIRIEQNKPLPFEDKAFDILFCSAVLEHVGDSVRQRNFIRECIRVSKKVFLTTPNRWFPMEYHTFILFLHWFPQKFYQRVLRLLGKDFWASTDNLNLLSKRKLRRLSQQSGVSIKLRQIRLLGIVSNLILIIREENEK